MEKLHLLLGLVREHRMARDHVGRDFVQPLFIGSRLGNALLAAAIGRSRNPGEHVALPIFDELEIARRA